MSDSIEEQNAQRKQTVSQVIGYALEQAQCAEANLENMVAMMPVLARHPLLPILRLQIKDTVETLEKLTQ
jgi:hypothetical protein